MKFNPLKPMISLLIFLTIASSCNMISGEVLAEIDSDEITLDEFQSYYYTQNKVLLNLDTKEIDRLSHESNMENHPTLNKSKFMDFLISRKLLYTKAMDDSSINKKELEAIIELTRLQGVATYYLSEKLKDEISVSDDEVNAFYNQNKQLFKGVPIDEGIINKIKQQIFMQKFERKSSEFVMNLIAESKVSREGFKKYLKEDAVKESQKPETAPAEEKPAEKK